MSSMLRSKMVVLFTGAVGARRIRLANGLPYPVDSPRITIEGPDPDRLLLVGSGIMTGLGVSSHKLSIAGNLARDVSRQTGRGIDLEIVSIPGLIASHAALRLKAIPLRGFDVVVVAIGINDALIGTPRRQWRQGIQSMLNAIESALPTHGRVFLVTIADPTQTPLFRPFHARLAARHALALNADTRTIARSHPRLGLIEFRVGPVDDPVRLYTRDSYSRWSRQLAPSIVIGLNQVHSAE